MATTVSMPEVFDAKDLARIENLDLLASRVVDGLLSGKHRSELKGGSAEFTEHRGYVPGDEIRLIDWKVFGKSDRYFIKQYIEQTCLQVIVVLDGSGSMAFGLKTGSKFHYARAVAACLTRLVLAPKRFGGAGGAGQDGAQLRSAAGKPESFPGDPAVAARGATDRRNVARRQPDGTGAAHQTARADRAAERLLR